MCLENLEFGLVIALHHTEPSWMTFLEQLRGESFIHCISISPTSITAIYLEQMLEQSYKPVTLRKPVLTRNDTLLNHGRTRTHWKTKIAHNCPWMAELVVKSPGMARKHQQYQARESGGKKARTARRPCTQPHFNHCKELTQRVAVWKKCSTQSRCGRGDLDFEHFLSTNNAQKPEGKERASTKLH